MAVNIEYLWQDRRRRMGMPLSFTKYALSDDRIFLEKGLLNMKAEEIQLYRVRDISLSITLWQRIFGMGTITVQSNDKTHPTLEIKNILHPREVKELIHDQVESVRKERNVGVGELLNDDLDIDL